LVTAYDRRAWFRPTVNLSATIRPENDRLNADIRGAMSTLPSWVQCSIIAVGVLLSPVLAFFMALIVGGLLGILREAGIAACLATVVVGAAAYFLARRIRAAPND